MTMSKRFKTKICVGGLGIAAYSYIAIDYLRHVSPIWHERLQPASLVFLLSTLLFEVLIVTAVLGILRARILGLHHYLDSADPVGITLGDHHPVDCLLYGHE
ncbi:hypothetical protein C5167_032336 [Papaver somniferum]|uniref:Uncharacterized protein n=1 Tax=Papaver somniferum TaxID=3469 RepID=A0A4Y7KAF4_PAPSO|nr:hypothetical protein C5167_032336 [Papaver somniferum]